MKASIWYLRLAWLMLALAMVPVVIILDALFLR